MSKFSSYQFPTNTICYGAFLIMALSCSPSKSNETVTDSTLNEVVNNQETPLQESVPPASNDETLEPPSGISNNFPDFSTTMLTDDSLEAVVNNRMASLIQVYDTIQYTTIKSTYSWERPYYAQAQDGEGTMAMETEEETKTWFFDRSYQLRAVSTEFNAGPDYPITISTLYLFSNDSLIAVSEHKVDESEVTVTSQITMVASQCPRCGTEAINGHKENGEVNYLIKNNLLTKQKEFYETMPELIRILKAGRKNAKVDANDFSFSINRTKEENKSDKSQAITYPVKFTIAKDLYSNYISKR